MPSFEPQNISIPTRDGDLPAALFIAPSQNANGDDIGDNIGDNIPNANVDGASESASRAVLIVLHDIEGLDETTSEACARLAWMGYAVLAPDLFAPGGGPKTTESAPVDIAATLSDSRVVSAAVAALDGFLAQSPGMSTHGGADAGIIGLGWGGAYALMAASHDARFRVACDIGGVISYAVATPLKTGSPLNFVANIQGALFAAFAGNDPDFPDVEIGRLRGRLAEHDKRGEVRVYPDAPPRFWRDADLRQTQALWRRLEKFLDEHIGDGAQDEFVSSTEYLDDRPDAGYANEESRLHA